MTILEQFAQTLVDHNADTQARIDSAVPSLVLDVLGAWLAGRTSDEGRRLRLAYGPLGSENVIDRVAYAVGVTRSTELDDIHIGSCITAGAVIVPTVLLLHSRVGAPAHRIGRAIAAGYDAMVRFGEAVQGPDVLYKGIWPTYLAAPLGTAAALASLLNLDGAGTANALALALAQVSGAVGGHAAGHQARWLLVGQAARSGCIAALAAQRGFGGDAGLLEHDWLARTHGIVVDTSPLQRALPAGSLSEISHKPHCGAKQTIAAVEAFRVLLERGVDPCRIGHIRVFVPSFYRDMIRASPVDRTGRIVSIAYQMALAAYHPSRLLDVNRKVVDDARMMQLMSLVDVLTDTQLDRAYPHHWPARVEIDLAPSGTMSCLVEAAYGDPARPLSASDHMAKFDSLSSGALGSQRAHEMTRLCGDVVLNPVLFEQLSDLFEEKINEQY